MSGQSPKTVFGRKFGREPLHSLLGGLVPQETTKFFKESGIKRPPCRSSSMSTLEECPRKFLYRDRLGIQPRGYASALNLGGMTHTVMQNLFLGRSGTDAVAAAHAVAQEEAARLKEAANEAGFVGGQDLDTVLQKLTEDCHKACAMAITLWNLHPFDTNRWAVLKDPADVPMVEVLLKVKWPGLARIPIICQPDLVLEDVYRDEDEVVTVGDARRIWLVDYKTTSISPKVRAAATSISPQMLLYRMALKVTLDYWTKEKLAPPSEVVGCIHVIMQKPGIKMCKKYGNFSNYLDHVVKWYKNRDAERPDDPPIVLDYDRFSGGYMPTELLLRLHQYRAASTSGPSIDRFYRAGGHVCTTFNSTCPYLPLCVSHPGSWPSLVKERYEIRFRKD